jgi:putative ABC transport system permease protein
MEVVLGSEVAIYNEISVGDTFESAHGLVSGGETHDDHPFTVVGILESSGTVLDKLILTSTESIWHVHEKPDEQQPRQYTAALVKFRSPMGIIQIPRSINTDTKIQAALPAYEINRLIGLIGIGINTLTGVATGIMIVAALSIFISLYNKLKERKYEFAVLRSYGASRWQLVSMIMMESFIIALLGSITGIIVARLSIAISQSYFGSQFPNISILNFTAVDFYLVLTSFFIGILAAIIPSIESFRMNIHNVLSES